jgi:hypothetical protein
MGGLLQKEDGVMNCGLILVLNAGYSDIDD